MKNTIGKKLTVGFIAISALMIILTFFLVNISQGFLRNSVGRSSVFLAQEIEGKINYNILHNIDHLEQISRGPLVQSILLESNREFEALDNMQEYIKEKDREWVSAPESQMTPFMQEIIDNRVSKALRKEIIEFWKEKYGYDIFEAVLITNKYGANIAQTTRTTDYRQDDEIWWQFARDKGVYYIGESEYIEGLEVYGVPIAVRIEDSDGNFMGVIQAIMSTKGIMKEAELKTKKYETTEIKVISGKGKMVFSSKPYKILEDVSDKNFFKRMKGKEGYFIAEEGGQRKLFSFTRSTVGMQEWLLLVSHNEAEVLKPIFILKKRIIYTSIVVIILVILVSFIITRTITKPLVILRNGTEIVGSGNLDYKVGTIAKDEIGELSRSFDNMVMNLKKMKFELERSNKELEQFAYVASHDLQEPLRMIASYIKLLEKRYKDKLDKDAQDFIFYTIDGTRRMQELIEGLLAYSRVGTKARPLKPTDCEDVLKQSLINLEVTIKESGAKITHEPLPTLMADDLQLAQLFQNLIGNAIKFRSKEPPRIHISAQKKENEWLFCVRDNGLGIDKQYYERIFGMLQRLHPKDEYPGAGIGLAISKRIVHRHNGRIWLESEPGKGSIFYFTIAIS